MQIHGGISGEELLLSGRTIIDFSVSVNPGAPLPILNHLPDFHRYPSRSSERFCAIVSSFYSINPEMVLPLGGATEGIYLLPRLFRKPAGLFPLYGDYVDAFARESIEVAHYDELPETTEADLFLIVNPQNPTGYYIEPEDILRFAGENPHAVVIVDEAYQEMGEQCETVISREMPENLVALRSLTKATGWPSLRAGFFAGSEIMIRRLRGWVLPWQITSLQLELIEYFYSLNDQFRATWDYSAQLRRGLVQQLKELNCTVLEGRAPFITFSLPGEVDIHKELFDKYDILIRDCRSFGLPGLYRVMPQSVQDNSSFIAALDSILMKKTNQN